MSGSFASSHADIPSQDGYSSQGGVTYIRRHGRWDGQFGVATNMELAFNTLLLLPGAAKTDEIVVACTETEHDGKARTTIANQAVLGREHGLASMIFRRLATRVTLCR